MIELSVFDCDELLYNYTCDDEGVHSLYYIDDSPWSIPYRGKLALSVKDDGDGFKFLFPAKLNNKHLDYGEFSRLAILLRIINRDHKLEIAEKIKL